MAGGPFLVLKIELKVDSKRVGNIYTEIEGKEILKKGAKCIGWS